MSRKKILWVAVTLLLLLVAVILCFVLKPWKNENKEEEESSQVVYIGEDNEVTDNWDDSEWL